MEKVRSYSQQDVRHLVTLDNTIYAREQFSGILNANDGQPTLMYWSRPEARGDKVKMVLDGEFVEMFKGIEYYLYATLREDGLRDEAKDILKQHNFPRQRVNRIKLKEFDRMIDSL